MTVLHGFLIGNKLCPKSQIVERLLATKKNAVVSSTDLQKRVIVTRQELKHILASQKWPDLIQIVDYRAVIRCQIDRPIQFARIENFLVPSLPIQL
jgi:hypothetical protein